MNISNHNYNYSYANSIAYSLKTPLFTVVSNNVLAAQGKPWESTVQRIIKLVLPTLVTSICIIPTGLLWMVGRTISHFSTTKVDPKNLSLAPTPIRLPEEASLNEAIDITEFYTRYCKLKGEGDKSKDSILRKARLATLCLWTQTQNPNIYPDDPGTRVRFCQQLSLYLRAILIKLQSGKVNPDKERDILMELAEAATRCYPTWLEVAAKLYAEITGQATPENKVLRLVQDYKESLILEFSQKEADAQWHALNFIRNILGDELGLNTTLNGLDPYAGRRSAIFSKSLSKWLFLHRYEDVNRLIAGIEAKINSENYDSSYYDLLVKVVIKQGIENPQDYVAEQFFTEDYKINPKGVNCMLRSVGIIC